MSAILGFITAKASGIAVGVAIPLVFGLLYKVIPSKITSLVLSLFSIQNRAIDKIDNPIRKGLYKAIALDICKLVEFEVPDKGAGAEKFKIASAKICSIIPGLKGHDAEVEKLIEESVEALNKAVGQQIVDTGSQSVK